MFWAYATTIGSFLAATAILSDIMAPLASRLFTAQIISFEILVWIRKLHLGPHEHFNWGQRHLRFPRQRNLGRLRLHLPRRQWQA